MKKLIGTLIIVALLAGCNLLSETPLSLSTYEEYVVKGTPTTLSTRSPVTPLIPVSRYVDADELNRQAGISKGYFILRGRQTTTAESPYGQANLYNYEKQNGAEQELELTDEDRALTKSDFTKPETITDAQWERIITFVSTITDPDDTPAPASTDTFNGSFLKF